MQQGLAAVPANIKLAQAQTESARRELAAAQKQLAALQARLDRASERIHELEEADRVNAQALIALRGKITRQREAITAATDALAAAK